MASEPTDISAELDAARAEIDRLRAEVARQQALLADNQFADELRSVLELTAISGVIAAPTSDREELHAIVETAASVLDAQAAALFLVDSEAHELWFEVAIGGAADQVKRFRIPLGQGVAGMVAATRQPVAISDVEADPRFAHDLASKVDYVPKTILCVPLILRDEVVGVLQMLDKAGGVPFSSRDLDVLGRFARLAAMTVEEMQLLNDLRRLFATLVAGLLQGSSAADLAKRLADSASELVSADAIRLAQVVQRVSRDERGLRVARDVLASIDTHLLPEDDETEGF